MTAQDFYAVCNHIDFVHRGARWDKARKRVDIDVHTKPKSVQERLCDRLAQSLGHKGWQVDVWTENGHILVSDKEYDG